MGTRTAEQVHRNMSAIRSRDTRPEIIVRHYLWGQGFRYRVNAPGLPGHPDIVLRKYRTCIFVNGCFWHGHEGCKIFRMPVTNRDFWQRKIARNRERDAEELRQLASMGWHCITVWECELKKGRREETLVSLARSLRESYVREHGIPSGIGNHGRSAATGLAQVDSAGG